MRLPVRAFWLMNSGVVRILAEKDMRLVAVQTARNGGEQMDSVMRNLTIEMGDVGKVSVESQLNEVRDEEGFSALKSLAAMM